MRPLLATIALACACGVDAPRPEVRGADAPVVVRVATWNVHDLFDEVDRLDPPGHLDGTPDAGAVEAKLARVAAVLSGLDADAVLLQEVEDLPLLARLAARSGYPEARLLEGNDPRGIDVGLLSRLPVAGYLGHAGDLDGDGRRLWPRDAIEAVLEAGGRRLVLLGTHLSSHLSDPAGQRRRLQAGRLRDLADGAQARWGPAVVLVAGDLNDEAAAPALAPLLGDGTWRDAAVLAGDAAWTWSDGSSRAAFDHVAFPASGTADLLAVRVAAGVEVAAASDHRPVVVDLLLR